MEGVLNLARPGRRLLAANPRNKERFLALEPGEVPGHHAALAETRSSPSPGRRSPGVEDEEFGRIGVPTMIIRGGVG